MPDERSTAVDLMRQRRFSEALPILFRLMEADPDDWWLHYMAGQCFRFMNYVNEAVDFLKKAASLNPSRSEVFLALGLALQGAEEYELAIDKLERAVALEPELFTAYNLIGSSYRKLGRFGKAFEWYTKAEEGLISTTTKQVHLEGKERFKEHVVNGRKTVVVSPHLLEKTRELLRSEPRYAVILNNLGLCLLELGDRASARRAFNESIEFTPDGYDYPDPVKNLQTIGH